MDAHKRKQTLLWLGTGAILLFILIRFTNFYGNPVQWSKQTSGIFTLFSFINVNKYPPSLLYALMTLGPALIFLALFEKNTGWPGRLFTIYGRTAMFYYLLHVYFIHLLAMFATTLCGHKWTDMIWGGFTNDNLLGYGFSLGIVYGVWVLVVAILYPLCKWYDRYKTSHKEKWWLSYL